MLKVVTLARREGWELEFPTVNPESQIVNTVSDSNSACVPSVCLASGTGAGTGDLGTTGEGWQSVTRGAHCAAGKLWNLGDYVCDLC